MLEKYLILPIVNISKYNLRTVSTPPKTTFSEHVWEKTAKYSHKTLWKQKQFDG